MKTDWRNLIPCLLADAPFYALWLIILVILTLAFYSLTTWIVSLITS